MGKELDLESTVQCRVRHGLEGEEVCAILFAYEGQLERTYLLTPSRLLFLPQAETHLVGSSHLSLI